MERPNGFLERANGVFVNLLVQVCQRRLWAQQEWPVYFCVNWISELPVFSNRLRFASCTLCICASRLQCSHGCVWKLGPAPRKAQCNMLGKRGNMHRARKACVLHGFWPFHELQDVDLSGFSRHSNKTRTVSPAFYLSGENINVGIQKKGSAAKKSLRC